MLNTLCPLQHNMFVPPLWGSVIPRELPSLFWSTRFSFITKSSGTMPCNVFASCQMAKVCVRQIANGFWMETKLSDDEIWKSSFFCLKECFLALKVWVYHHRLGRSQAVPINNSKRPLRGAPVIKSSKFSMITWSIIRQAFPGSPISTAHK